LFFYETKGTIKNDPIVLKYIGTISKKTELNGTNSKGEAGLENTLLELGIGHLQDTLFSKKY